MGRRRTKIHHGDRAGLWIWAGLRLHTQLLLALERRLALLVVAARELAPELLGPFRGRLVPRYGAREPQCWLHAAKFCLSSRP